MCKCVICGHNHDENSMSQYRVFNPKKSEYVTYHVCYECRDKMKSDVAIHDYYYKPNPMFYNAGDSDLYLGVELEADDGYAPELAAQRISIPHNEFYIKHDGSLGNNGIEIVSHPGTLDAHRKNVLHWKEVLSVLHSQHYRSHKTSTCGLHVHVNRSFFGETNDEIDLNISKVIMLTQRFWDDCIVPFSRRNLTRLQRWAKKPNCKFEQGASSADVIQRHKNTLQRDHYNGVNIMPHNTIEFRMFRGTLVYSTLMATLEFVHVLCHFAKKIDMNQIDNTKWDDIFADVNRSDFKYLFDYLATRTKINPNSHEDVFYKKGEAPAGMQELKIGDMVIVRDWDDMEREYGLTGNCIDVPFDFTPEMRRFCGRNARIFDITEYHPVNAYVLDFMDERINDVAADYMFSAEMLTRL